jgi:hypothetical protein
MRYGDQWRTKGTLGNTKRNTTLIKYDMIKVKLSGVDILFDRYAKEDQ